MTIEAVIKKQSEPNQGADFGAPDLECQFQGAGGHKSQCEHLSK